MELCAGMTLRDRGLYALAARCFEQSGDAAARFDALARDARVLEYGRARQLKKEEAGRRALCEWISGSARGK